MASQAPGSIFSLGHWAGGKGAPTLMQDVLNQQTYTNLSTDYEGALQQVSTSAKGHVIITDGVFWKSGKDQYAVHASEISKAISARLQSGGRFGLLAAPSSYDFYYKSAKAFASHSDRPGARCFFEYTTTKRPFTIWTFTAPGTPPPVNARLLSGLPNRETPLLELCLGDALIGLQPVSKSSEEEAEILGNLSSARPPGLHPLYTGTVLSSDPKKAVILTFECHIDSRLIPKHMADYEAWLKNELTADLSCWNVDHSGDALKVSPVPAPIDMARFQPKTAKDTDPDGGRDARLFVHLRRPAAPGSILAWVVTIHSKLSGFLDAARELSTDDDSEGQAERLLNFKDLAQEISTRNNVVGRVIVITEWYPQ